MSVLAIKHSYFYHVTRGKKKVCPDCCTPIARKCKKCPSCGKGFGVFTFGRKLCPVCGRTNKARMTECFQCGHPLSNAPKAVPKVYNGEPTVSTVERHKIERIY